MNLDTSLLAAYLFDAKGQHQPVGWGDIQAWKPKDGMLWIHLERENSVARTWLQAESGLSEIVTELLLEPDSRPSIYQTTEGVMLNLRGVNLNPGESPDDMVSIRMWVEENRIITTRQLPVMAVRDVHDMIKVGTPPASTCDFVVRIADRLIDRMSPIIVGLQEDLDTLDESLSGEIPDQVNQELGRIRRQAINLRRFLYPQIEVLDGLLKNPPAWFLPSSREHLHTQRDRTKKYVEMLDAMRDLSKICQEEIFMLSSDQNAKTTMVLTIIAAIFLPLSFITGLLGINVGGIPGATHELGFWLVSLLMVVIVVIQIAIFKFKKWF